MLTKDSIRSAVTREVFDRGTESRNLGNVRSWSFDGDSAWIEVVSSSDKKDFYRVFINLNKEHDIVLAARCTCPYNMANGGWCKHIVAALLDVIAKQTPTKYIFLFREGQEKYIVPGKLVPYASAARAIGAGTEAARELDLPYFGDVMEVSKEPAKSSPSTRRMASSSWSPGPCTTTSAGSTIRGWGQKHCRTNSLEGCLSRSIRASS